MLIVENFMNIKWIRYFWITKNYSTCAWTLIHSHFQWDCLEDSLRWGKFRNRWDEPGQMRRFLEIRGSWMNYWIQRKSEDKKFMNKYEVQLSDSLQRLLDFRYAQLASKTNSNEKFPIKQITDQKILKIFP